PTPLPCRSHTPTPAIYPLSLHDALPIFSWAAAGSLLEDAVSSDVPPARSAPSEPILLGRRPVAEKLQRLDEVAAGHRRALIVTQDRKSTRLNSSHVKISYAVFCLKKKTK